MTRSAHAGRDMRLRCSDANEDSVCGVMIGSYQPGFFPATTQLVQHRLLDARSLAMHVVIAAKIQRDPRLLEKSRLNLQRWRVRTKDNVPRWMHEWEAVLERSWPEIEALITNPSEESARMRQSSPLTGVLTPSERRKIHHQTVME